MKALVKALCLFTAGGILYLGVEIAWRGFSHPAMFVVGGLCFVAIGLINELFSYQMSILLQALLAAAAILTIEFISGCILNLWLGLDIWDYSNLPLNLLGQIQAYFAGVWCVLSVVGIVLDDFIRHFLFGEEKPRYRI